MKQGLGSRVRLFLRDIGPLGWDRCGQVRFMRPRHMKGALPRRLPFEVVTLDTVRQELS